MSKKENIAYWGIHLLLGLLVLGILLPVITDRPPVRPDIRDVILDRYHIIGVRPEHEGDCWRLKNE